MVVVRKAHPQHAGRLAAAASHQHERAGEALGWCKLDWCTTVCNRELSGLKPSLRASALGVQHTVGELRPIVRCWPDEALRPAAGRSDTFHPRAISCCAAVCNLIGKEQVIFQLLLLGFHAQMDNML